MQFINKNAIQATLHCLTGCAIGEVLGMILATALAWHNALQILLSIFLAFVFGYSLTMWPLLKNKMTLKAALLVALAADTVSIVVMEIADNGFVALVPGALNATLGDWLFWWSLAVSLVVAFILAVPVNGYLMAKGKGHAAVHAHHHHHH
ncbi:MAG TPA: DUF4396 domain-containing protein [Candidatus Saccharimonadales bacterium]|nr:DUF4396 domain-containing protein [Candidatus Saccharimonadales bacterium]